MRTSEKPAISIAVVGDIILNKRCRQFTDEPFRRLTAKLRECDAALGNLEGLYHDWEMPYGSNYNPYPIVNDAVMLEEVSWLGFSAVSAANNHAYDCGEAGLIANMTNCVRHGLPACGVGMSSGEARAPVYIETDSGRIALLGCTSTFGLPDLSHAGPPGAGIRAKPGVAVLRHHTEHEVPADVFGALLAADQRLSAFPSDRAAGSVSAFGGTVSAGASFATRTRCNEQDLMEIGRSLRSARAVSDIVVLSVHCHENGASGQLYNALHKPSTPEFLRELAHSAIDNGCDIFFAHGPHILRGIEIYKGKPIFYSLSDFFFQPETIKKTPPAAFEAAKLPHDAGAGAWGHSFMHDLPYAWGKEPRCYQGLVAICEFSSGDLTAVRLVPCELSRNGTNAHRGRPAIAEKADADDILSQLRDLSAEFGTEIGDGTGMVRLERS